MPDTSPNLGLPYIQPAQAQKHVTHNEAIERLDALTQLAVLDADRTAPPAASAEGDRHIVAAGATGDWAGQDGAVALRAGGGWLFLAPRAGWCAGILADGRTLTHDGTGWVAKAPNLDGVEAQNLARLGVSALADAANPLTAAGPGTLLTHAGTDHRVTVNKAGDGDTASLLFQSGWTGHAEMGLAGSTAFSVKVSADGGTWATALTADAAAGEVRIDLPLAGAAVQSGPTDATAGRVMTVGAFGLGSGTAEAVPDLDATDTPTGFYTADAGTAGPRPAGASADGFVSVESADAAHVAQTYWDANADGTWTRRYRGAGWTGWEPLHAETGSTPTGQFLKPGGGVLTCWTTGIASGPLDTAVGGLYRGQAVTWTFPAAFAAPPCVTATATGGLRFVSIVSTTATEVTVQVLGPAQDAASHELHLVAHGLSS